MKEIKDIVIVGGGTAGLTTALTFQNYFPHYNISVVKSPKVEIVGVGEGSTEHWDVFMDLVNIDHIELINETDATIKIGILFNDWSYIGSTYTHALLSSDPTSIFGTLDNFDLSVIKNDSNPYVLSKFFKDIQFKNKVVLNTRLKSSNQYHFDTFKLNKYLTKKCIERNINIITEHISNVNLDNQGNIASLTSHSNSFIKGDFFIDCSGFKRLLSSKLKSQWISYKDYLPLNQAITFPTDLDLKKGIEPYTKATALQNGWTWQIPTQTRYGNGYVFSNEYTTSDHALNELNTHLGINVEKVAKDIKFEAGKVDKFWIKNCVNIGLAGSFVEPLEAQSIGFSLIQADTLCRFLNSWLFDPSISQSYNEILNDSFDNIVNYIQIHYLTKRNDSKFWYDKPFKLTEFNKSTLFRFSHGIFNPTDFKNPQYLMFNRFNFYQVYYGLGLIDSQKILKSRTFLPQDHLNEALNNFHQYQSEPFPNSTSHINYLKLIRENYSS